MTKPKSRRAVGARSVGINVPIGLWNRVADISDPTGQTVRQAIKVAIVEWCERQEAEAAGERPFDINDFVVTK